MIEVVPAHKARWHTKHVRFAMLSVILVATAAGIVWLMTQTPDAVHYQAVAVGRGDVTHSVTATGTINPELTIVVGSYVSGVIRKVFCDYNTKVTAGQVCAEIDPRPYQTVVDQDKAALDVARAQLEKDTASLDYARLSYQRNAALARRDFATQDAADMARSVYGQAMAQLDLDQATIEQRQAALATSMVNLGYTDIVSPVDGTVVSRNITQGQTVAASFQTPTLFLIATDLTRMEVDTNISESDIGGIQEGDSATFTVDAFPGRVFSGRVTQVRQSPQTVQNVVTFDSVVGVTNADLALKPGMTASTRIVVARKNDVMRVPNQALRYVPASAVAAGDRALSANAGAEVWVLRDGAPRAVAIETGLSDDNFTEVTRGDFKPGDHVIIAEYNAKAGSSMTLFGFGL